MTCRHETPQWHLADCNEDGWKCAECGHAFGFRPDFDREHTHDKVDTILFWLHEQDFIYISNSSEGASLTHAVAEKCRETNTYDQQSIIHLIVSHGLAGHAAFWREEAEQAMCSHPSRTLVARPTRQDADGSVSRCNACGHELTQRAAGPLFESKEPF